MSRPREVKLGFSWPRLIKDDGELSPAVKHVALNLALYMNQAGGSAFPSLETQATDTGRSKSTIAEALGLLARRGYLVKTPGGGRGHTTLYEATLPETVRQEDTFSKGGGSSETPAEATAGPLRAGDVEAGPGTLADAETVRSPDSFGAAETVRDRPKLSAQGGVNSPPTRPDWTSNGPTERTTLPPAAAGEGERDPVEQLRWALTGELGCAPITRSERREWANAINELVDVAATTDQVRDRCAAYRRVFPKARLTAPALVRHWGFLGADVEARNSPHETWVDDTSWRLEPEEAHWIVDAFDDVDEQTRADLHRRIDDVRARRAEAAA